jgi:hypothetical protein
MAYLTTGLDLKLDALQLAGEPPTGSSYGDQQIYEWLTLAQQAVVAGGPFGPRNGPTAALKPQDWYWARAWPRGVIQLVQPYNQGQTASATFTAGMQQVTVAISPSFLPDLHGYRVMLSSVPARHLIDSVDNTVNPRVITLIDPWTGPTQTTPVWLAYPDTYTLPADFVRGMSPLFLYSFPSNIPTTQTIDVIDPVDLERQYPQTFPWGGNASATTTGSGMPVLAARVTDTRLRFSHFCNTPANPFPVQAEFEYIRRPQVIAEGTIPPIPIEFRRILAYGAAFLILDDKKSSQQDSMLADFISTYDAMAIQHGRDMRRMSSRWGVIQPPRSSGNRSIMLTETGLPIYVW